MIPRLRSQLDALWAALRELCAALAQLPARLLEASGGFLLVLLFAFFCCLIGGLSWQLFRVLNSFPEVAP